MTKSSRISASGAFLASFLVLFHVKYCDAFFPTKIDSDDHQQKRGRPRWLRRRGRNNVIEVESLQEEVVSLANEKERFLAFDEELARMLTLNSMSASMPSGPPTIPTQPTPTQTPQRTPAPSPSPTPMPTPPSGTGPTDQCAISLDIRCVTTEEPRGACEDVITPVDSVECSGSPSSLCFRYTGMPCDLSQVGEAGLVGCNDVGALEDDVQMIIQSEAGGVIFVDEVVGVGDVVCAAEEMGELPGRVVVRVQSTPGGDSRQIIFLDTSCEPGGLVLNESYGSVDLVSFTNADQGQVVCSVPVSYEYVVTNSGGVDLTITKFDRLFNNELKDILRFIPEDDRELSQSETLAYMEVGEINRCVDTSVEVISTVVAQGPDGTPDCDAMDSYMFVFEISSAIPTEAPAAVPSTPVPTPGPSTVAPADPTPSPVTAAPTPIPVMTPSPTSAPTPPSTPAPTPMPTPIPTLAEPLPAIVVTYMVDPDVVFEPGEPVTYTVMIENTSAPTDPITITSLTTDTFGPLEGKGSCSIGMVIQPGPDNKFTCTFSETIFGSAGDVFISTVTASGNDDEGTSVSDSDEVSVNVVAQPPPVPTPPSTPAPTPMPTPIPTLAEPLPAIVVTYMVDPDVVFEPGEPVTYTVMIENTSAPPDPITITSLTTDTFGPLEGKGSCSIGMVIQPGPDNKFTCTFSETIFGSAGDVFISTVTASGNDDEGTSVSDSDEVSVNVVAQPPPVPTPPSTPAPTPMPTPIPTLAEPLPAIVVTYMVDPDVVFEPGEPVTYTVMIENTSAPTDPITITSLTTDTFGPLEGKGSCSIGMVIQPGPDNKFTCTFSETIFGSAGDVFISTVTASGNDDEGTPVSDSDEVSVNVVAQPPPVPTPPSTPAPTPMPTPIPTLAEPLPAIVVSYMVDPDVVFEPGEPVTYTVMIENTSAPTDPITITSLTTDTFGPLEGKGSCSIGMVIQPGPDNKFTCTFSETIFGSAGDVFISIVTASGNDNEGTPVSDSDEVSVNVVAQPTLAPTGAPNFSPSSPPSPPPSSPPTFANCEIDLEVECVTGAEPNEQCEMAITREDNLECLATPTRLCFRYTAKACGPLVNGLTGCIENSGEDLEENVRVTARDQNFANTYFDDVVRTGDDFCIESGGEPLPLVLIFGIENQEGDGGQALNVDASCMQDGLTLMADYGGLQLVRYTNSEGDINCPVAVKYEYSVMNRGSVNLTIIEFARTLNGEMTNILPELSNGTLFLMPQDELTYVDDGEINRCMDTNVEIDASVRGRGPEMSSECSDDDTYEFTYAEDGAFAPTASPVLTPTDNGSMLCGMPTAMREEALFTEVSSISDAGLVMQGGTPQNEAFNWLVEEDPVQVCPDEELAITQRYVLAVLYYSTQGDTAWSTCNDPSLASPAPCSSDDSRFLSDSNVCGWIENACDSMTGELIVLGVDENNLSGSIPSELDALTKLQDIDMDENCLNMSIPEELFSIPTLTNLDLDTNKLVGPIPSALYSASLLRIVDLNNNILEGSIQTEIGLLSDLQAFAADENKMTGEIPSEIGLLNELEFFLFDGNTNVNGNIPTEMGNNLMMIQLDLHNNMLTGELPSEIGRLGQLSQLSVWNNKLNGSIPSELGQLESAERILLHYNDFMGGMPIELCEWVAAESDRILTADCFSANPKVTCPAACQCTCVPPVSSGAFAPGG